MNRRTFRRTFRRSGQALIIGLVVCVVVMMLMAIKFLGPTQNADGTKGKSIPKQAEERGSEVELNSNLGQIRQLIGMYKNDNDGKVPASYQELRRYGKDYPAEMWLNPVDKKPLVYDPATGTIDAQGAGAQGDQSRQSQRVDRASQANNSDPAQGQPAQPQAPSPPSQVAPGVPNPNDIVGKIPQPGGNIPAEDQ